MVSEERYEPYVSLVLALSLMLSAMTVDTHASILVRIVLPFCFLCLCPPFSRPPLLFKVRATVGCRRTHFAT